jgi:Co/Zn/Cd efflux system component
LNGETPSRTALALLALINGAMAFVESSAAMPALSTALLAGSLPFLKEGALAWLDLWMSFEVIKSARGPLRVIGGIMMLLGVGVLAVAVLRYRAGSHPSSAAMAIIAIVALAANLGSSALIARIKNLKRTKTQRLNEAATCIAVLAATGIVAVTRSNLGDVVIGGVLAVLYLVSGWDMLRTGQETA